MIELRLCIASPAHTTTPSLLCYNSPKPSILQIR
jgi:hypothetical protein